MAPGLTANWAFRWPLTHVTPSVFHADQHGIVPFLNFGPQRPGGAFLKIGFGPLSDESSLSIPGHSCTETVVVAWNINIPSKIEGVVTPFSFQIPLSIWVKSNTANPNPRVSPNKDKSRDCLLSILSLIQYFCSLFCVCHALMPS